VKYAAKQSGKAAGVPEPGASEAAKTKASSWVVPPCRFLFFVVLVFTIWEGAREVVWRVLRSGKKLVSKAHVADTNDRNEYGSFVPERRHPFRSSTSDVHQAVFRCNGGLQVKDRAVPEEVLGETPGAGADPVPSTSAGAAAEPTASEQAWSCGFFPKRSLSPLRKAVLQ